MQLLGLAFFIFGASSQDKGCTVRALSFFLNEWYRYHVGFFAV